MKINEILTESLSRIVYHYTNITSALKILSSGVFQLSSGIGSIEQQYSPKGKPYFLSTTRTRHGGYHDTIGNQAVLFELDGNWFNRHYISYPVDYWENRDPAKVSHRSHEAEDRVFSKSPTIPINGVISVHVYINPSADPEVRAWGRQVLIAAKKQGIRANFYTDKQAWKNFDSRKKGDIAILTGQDGPISSVSRHKGYLLPWIELLQAKDKSQLSKKADNLRYSLMYTYDKQDAVSGLKNELSNARKPNSGPDRAHAVKIINFMQQNNLATVEDLVDALAKKWKTNKDTLSENEVYSITEAGAVPVYYFAYGMLTDPEYMEAATLVGAAILPNFEFELLLYANVVPSSGNQVGGSLWAIDKQLLSQLDSIEGYPSLYDRKTVPVFVDGQRYVAELYTMTPQTRRELEGTQPGQGYINRIIRGYQNAGVDLEQLNNALGK